MVATAPQLVPVVALTRRRAPTSWSTAGRAEMSKRLAALGITITELSDARERCGLARLSDAAPEARRVAHLLLLGTRGQRALAAVRAERAELAEALSTCDRKAIAEARRLLDLRRSTGQLRLGELRALYAQTRIVEISGGG